MIESIIAVLGALGGAWIGGQLTLRSQQSEQAFKERTWFHDQRLETYSEFIAEGRNVARQEGDVPKELSRAFLTILERLELMASQEVHEKAVDLHTKALCVGEALKGEHQGADRQFSIAVAAFQRAVRKELGIKRKLENAGSD